MSKIRQRVSLRRPSARQPASTSSSLSLGVALASSGVREFGCQLGWSWIHGSGFHSLKLQP